jgi:hypothetical protein
MKHKVWTSMSVLALAGGLAIATGAGVSGADGHGKGHHHNPPVAMTGTTTCTVKNLSLHFSAPLTATASTAAITVKLSGSALRHCTNNVQGNVRVRSGQLRGLNGSLDAGATCTSFLTGTTLPAFAGGTAHWSPRARIAASTGISFPAGALSTTTGGNLQMAFTGGTVAGSYATTAATLTATSRATAADLTAACAATGLDGFHFSGTVTL